MCECEEEYSGKSCRYLAGTEEKMTEVKEILEDYVKSGRCDFTLEELESVTINMAVASEYLEGDLTSTLDTCFKSYDYPTFTHVFELEPLIQALSYLISVKVSHFETGSDIKAEDIDDLKSIIERESVSYTHLTLPTSDLV
eukprot:TRINITY_DN13078_c0_g1_i1.p1 TRINITY_DN13078_c0_g1~~TRINITY_DN13078_c0_g1_i1.p1  ORF type:complete len:141 (+),score=31.01 TRINITY_DN13078_c0_g1_i1:172-594(+)